MGRQQRRLQNATYETKRMDSNISCFKRDGKFNSNKSLLRLNAVILILYFPRLAIFGCGKQRAICANYFAAKKSASREKIRKWKIGL